MRTIANALSPTWPSVALLALACGGGTAHAPPADMPPESTWLKEIGTGPEQTQRVCATGARDGVALALCAPETSITSLEELYSALELGPSDPRRVAATTHSLSLSGRSVSPANPRVIVFADTDAPPGPIPYEKLVAVAFARGQQLVELVGLDPVTYDYNFYLLSFEQRCNGSRCTPADLLGPRVERDWLSWTLYSDVDLEDTALNCSTCHRRFGPDNPKQLLMRQVSDPWMHWGDFRQLEDNACPNSSTQEPPWRVVATADGLDLMRALEGDSGNYGGVPVTQLHAAESGDLMADLLVDAEFLMGTRPGPPHPYGQLYFGTRETLCERFYTGRSPTWEEDRSVSQAGGFPFPYHSPDVLDLDARSQLLASREAFWAGQAEHDPFEVAASLLAADVPAAVGFLPRETDTAEEIVKSLCLRCHAPDTDPSLTRARFDAEAETIDPATFRELVTRLALPPSSSKAMPPRLAGELPEWARERLLNHWAGRCSVPGACRATSSSTPAK